eukprot:1152050-Pelagomonas_calceolata.AAC.3
MALARAGSSRACSWDCAGVGLMAADVRGGVCPAEGGLAVGLGVASCSGSWRGDRSRQARSTAWSASFCLSVSASTQPPAAAAAAAAAAASGCS